MKKRILMITPENTEINRFRKKQANNFMQITMPYLAGYIDENKYEITLIDEYNETRVAFKPKNMTPEELFEGYMWFRKEFYSMRSIVKRLWVSRANVIHNLIVNLGYRLSIGVTDFKED